MIEMYPRTEYEMTQADLDTLLAACKSVPVMMVGGVAPSSPQDNANRAWAALGAKMGFDGATVNPSPNGGQRFFTAIPSETESARTERETREAEEKRQQDIARLSGEIAERQEQLDALEAD